MYFIEECWYTEHVSRITHKKTDDLVISHVTKCFDWKRARTAAQKMSEINPGIVFHFDGSNGDWVNQKFVFYYLNGKRVSYQHALEFMRKRERPYEYATFYINDMGIEESRYNHMTLRSARTEARALSKIYGTMAIIRDFNGNTVEYRIGNKNYPANQFVFGKEI